MNDYTPQEKRFYDECIARLEQEERSKKPIPAWDNFDYAIAIAAYTNLLRRQKQGFRCYRM